MGYDTFNAPILLDYESALAHYHSVTPIRKKTVRPLGARRYHNVASIDLIGDDVALIYYGMPVVVWHPDQSLTVHYPAYCNAYEPDKLAHFLPPGLDFEWNKVRLVVLNRDTDQRVLLKRGESLRLVPTGETKSWHTLKLKRRVWAFEQMPVEFNYAKRPGMLPKLMNRHMSAFLRWYDDTVQIAPTMEEAEVDRAMGKLVTEATGATVADIEFMNAEYNRLTWNAGPDLVKRKHEMSLEVDLINYYPVGGRRTYKPKFHHLAGVRMLYNWMLEGNEEHWYNALCVIVQHQIQQDWNTRVYRINGVGDRESIVEYIEKVVGIVHRDEVFKRVELPQGTLPSKTNRDMYNDYSFIHFPEKTDIVSETSTQAGE